MSNEQNQQNSQTEPGPGKINPGDQAPPGTPGTGDDICPKCGGTGRIKGDACENCGGTGTITEGIGGG